jgi:hypothetical protein
MKNNKKKELKMCIYEISEKKFKTSGKFYCIVAKGMTNQYKSLFNDGKYQIGEWYNARHTIVPIGNYDLSDEYESGFHLFLSKKDAMEYYRKGAFRGRKRKYFLATCSIEDIKIYGYQMYRLDNDTRKYLRVIVADKRRIDSVSILER